MDTLRARGFVLVALAVFLGVVTGSAPGHAMCDPTTDPDKTDIAKARAAVAASCDCAGATSHGAYVSCAVQHANLTLVNKSCAGAVKRCAARSTCGKPTGAVTCCVTKASGTKCKIKRDAAHCSAPSGATACVGSYPSCCDACGQGGCVTTSTTSTSTSTTTSSTVVTLCGNGVIDPGEMCDGENYCQGCTIPIYACCQIGPCVVSFFPVGGGCVAGGGTEIIGAHPTSTGPCPLPLPSPFTAGTCDGQNDPIAPTSFCCPLRGGGCLTTPVATVGEVIVAVWGCAFNGDPASAPSLGTCGPGDVCIPAH